MVTNDQPSTTRSRLAALGRITLLTGLVLAAGALGAQLAGALADPGDTPPMDAQWKQVDQLISEQKMQAALDVVETIRDTSRGAGDEENWTRAIVREVQLRSALHGYETSVRFLRETPWPEKGVHRDTLELFYAQSLVNYLRAYAWEIGTRERVVSTDEVDLKRWTREQLFSEAVASFQRVWAERDSWGDGPVGPLAEYVQSGSYPARIRGTLRDTVTYFGVSLLADSSFWRAQESNELFRLDVEELLAATPPTDGELADPDRHPLEKLVAVLADLESWHREAERPEAALEARLETGRQLMTHLTSERDRDAIETSLRRDLDAIGRHLPWWSMGMAQLAEIVRGLDEPDALVEAREIAIDGRLAHPQSPGGQRCDHIVQSIESPSYQLASMTTDGPGRRSIQVRHRNLDRLFFRAYRLDPNDVVRHARDYNLVPGYRDIPELVERRPDARWAIDLPDTPDYRDHTSFVTPPLEAKGLWVVVASAKASFGPSSNKVAAVNLLVSDFVLVTRTGDGTREITVRDGGGGAPVGGAAVELWRFDWQRGHFLEEKLVTRSDGRVTFRAPDEHGTFFALATVGDDTTLDPSYFSFGSRYTTTQEHGSLVYTDRSVYRPGQTMHWKVVTYRGVRREGDLSAVEGASVQVELLDANGESAGIETVVTNRFGSASGTFPVPAGRLLGAWSIRTSFNGGTSVRVEEYKRPTFEVALDEPDEPLRLNRLAELTGRATYYFGLPVTEGGVAWHVTREPVYPRWWWWYGWPTGGQSQVVANGTAELDADGRFDVAFTPEADEDEAERGVTFRYRLTAEVTDLGGETRDANRSFRLGFVTVEASIDQKRSFTVTNDAVEVSVRRTDLDGTARAGSGSWRLVRLDQPETTLAPAEQPLPAPPADGRFATDGDRLRPRWAGASDPRTVLRLWPDGREVRRGNLEHGDDGTADLEIGRLTPGAYRFYYETTDPYGARFETHDELLVVAPGRTELSLPAALLVERATASVGGKVRLLVHSGYDDQELILEIFRDGVVRERHRLDSGGGLQLLEIPIGRTDRGGLGFALTTVHDHHLIRQQQSVFVPWDDRELAIGFETFRDRLRPGDQETWRVTVSGDDDERLAEGAAELLAYMYDRSLDLFAPHTPPAISSLYPNRASVPWVGANLGQGGEAWISSQGFPSLPGYPTFTADRLVFFSGYGIGGPGRRQRYLGQAMKSAPAPAAMAMDAAGELERRVTVTSESPLLEEAVEADEAKSKRENAPATPREEGQEAVPEVRENFAETAFFEPHLVLDGDGGVAFEFTVPDSVTEWNVWVHGLTRDLRGGSLQQQTRSVKELLVRPYLPRFLREGDRAEIEIVVNNAGDDPFEGELTFEIFDPETEASLADAFGLTPEAARGDFAVEPGGSTSMRVPLVTPSRVGSVGVRVVGRAGDLSDGEQRPLPVLPGRIHLAQSRFVTLSDADRRTLRFADMAANDDPTLIHDQLVVTLDAQLFYGVLGALPYLIDYPYECTEQTLNRFLSAGVMSTLFDDYPAVERMAEKLAATRDTWVEAWNDDDPNRKMLLEETPWLRQSRGGDVDPRDLIKVLDPEIARANRTTSLAKLQEAQTAIGGFPWFPGGPPSPWMTLYLLDGFSRALEFGVEVPQPMVRQAWSYMHRHYLDTVVRHMMESDCCWETVTYLNYVLSAYPDPSWTGGVFSADDRQRMLDFSFRHWKLHSPRLKALLALTLHRADRADDAALVFDSIMDSAKTTEDEGTFWAQEDRSWLWYNDTVESHAFILRAMIELSPDDARRHGLVQWLLLNKKLNHWKSTRATSEAIYGLVHYLVREGTLAAREEATVTLGDEAHQFVWLPDEYTGKKNQIVVDGPDVDSTTMAEIVIEKETPGFLFASATWHFSTEQMPEEARGDFFQVHRTYYRRVHDGREWTLVPIEDGARLEPGDQLEVHLSLRTKHAAEYVHLRDPRGAGFEPETLHSQWKWDLGIAWYEEVRDSGANFFFERLPVGEYTFRYRLRTSMAGTFKVAPATVQSMYAPEFVAYSAGEVLDVEPR